MTNKNSLEYLFTYFFIQSRQSELFGFHMCLPVSLATKFLHLRTTKNKIRTRDHVLTLTIRTSTTEVSVENILQIKFVF